MKSDTNPSSESRTHTFGYTDERADMPKLLVALATMRTRLTTEIAFWSGSDYLQKKIETLKAKKKLKVNYTLPPPPHTHTHTHTHIYIYIYASYAKRNVGPYIYIYIYTHIYIYPYIWAYVSEEPRVYTHKFLRSPVYIYTHTHISEEMQEAKLCCRKWEITKSDRRQTVSRLQGQCRKWNIKNVTQKTGNTGKWTRILFTNTAA